MKINLELENLHLSGLSKNEASALARCLTAYAANAAGQMIHSIGLHKYTGEIYISLENGITIASGTDLKKVKFYAGINDEDYPRYETALRHL